MITWDHCISIKAQPNIHDLQSQETCLQMCPPSEVSDQPAHSRSLIRNFTGRIVDGQESKFSSCGQRRHKSDCTDAQSDLSLRLALMWKRHVAAYMSSKSQVCVLKVDTRFSSSAAWGGWVRQWYLVSYVTGVPYWDWLSWARPAILVAGKGRGGMFLILLFLHFHSFSSISPARLFHLLFYLFCLFSPFLWETTQNDPQGLTYRWTLIQ